MTDPDAMLKPLRKSPPLFGRRKAKASNQQPRSWSDVFEAERLKHEKLIASSKPFKRERLLEELNLPPESALNDPVSGEKIVNISLTDIPDREIKVNLRDVPALLEGYDPEDPDATVAFCNKLAEMDIEAGKKHSEHTSRAKKEGRAEWSARNKSLKESAGAFVDRVYGDLIQRDEVFHTGTLQNYDKSLSTAYGRWVEKVEKGEEKPRSGHPLPDSGRVRVGKDQTRPPTDEERRWVLRHLAREKKATNRAT